MLAAIKKVLCLAYYTSQLRFNYYFRGGEPDAYWLGSGAEFLGLYGKVLKAVVLYIFKGFRPPPDGGDDGGAALIPLVQNAGSGNRTNALDLVLSDPKSASGFWALSGPDIRKQYDEVELDAVKETIAYMERFHGWSRKGHNGEEYIRAALTFAAFPHSTNRELEPQKHHHLLLMNVAACEDGKTRAVYAKPLYDNIHVIGAVYRNALARGLRNKLGLRLELDREQFFRLKDFSVDLADYWSTRRHQVLAEQIRVGEMSGKAAGVAATRTAKLKGTLPPLVELHEGWRDEALEMFGYTPETLRNMMGRAKPTAYKKGVRDKALKAALKQTLQAHNNFFREFDFHRWAIAYLCIEGYEIDDLLAHCDEFLSNHKDLVELTNNFGQRFFSTHEILEEELVLLDTGDFIRHRTSFPGVTRELQDRVIAEQQAIYALAGKQLDKEQLQAIRTITSNRGDFELLTGVAGAGKTMVLETVAKILIEAGYNVVGMGPTNRSANELKDATKTIETHTLASGLGDWKLPLGWKLCHHADMLRRTAQVYRQRRGKFFKGGKIKRRKTWKLKKPRPLKIDNKTVVIVDELSMLGTRQFLKLLKYVKKNGAKLVGTGDYDQIQSQERGGPLRSFCKRYETNDLTTAKRQRHVWGRKMVEEFKAGNVSKALTILRHCGEVYGAETVEELIHKAVVSWSRWGIETPNDVAILCLENDQVFAANQKCQALRYEHGKLKGPPLEVQYTPQERNYTEHVFVGDKITFQSNYKPKGYSKNDGGTVLAIKGRVATIEVHGKADRKGKPLIVDVEVRSNRPSAISLGYAGTNFKAQAASIENVIAMLTGVMLDRQNAYTALSRFREHLILLALEHELENFWNNAQDSPLCTAMAKNRQKGLAYDLLPKPEALPKPETATLDVWGEYLNSKRSVAQFAERSVEEQQMLRQAHEGNESLFSDWVDAEGDTPHAVDDDPYYEEPDYAGLAAHWAEADASAYIEELESDEYFSNTPTEFDKNAAWAEYQEELTLEKERANQLIARMREEEKPAAEQAHLRSRKPGELTAGVPPTKEVVVIPFPGEYFKRSEYEPPTLKMVVSKPTDTPESESDCSFTEDNRGSDECKPEPSPESLAIEREYQGHFDLLESYIRCLIQDTGGVALGREGIKAKEQILAIESKVIQYESTHETFKLHGLGYYKEKLRVYKQLTKHAAILRQHCEEQRQKNANELETDNAQNETITKPSHLTLALSQEEQDERSWEHSRDCMQEILSERGWLSNHLYICELVEEQGESVDIDDEASSLEEAVRVRWTLAGNDYLEDECIQQIQHEISRDASIARRDGVLPDSPSQRIVNAARFITHHNAQLMESVSKALDKEAAWADCEQEAKEERERIAKLSAEIREDELAAKKARIACLETGKFTPTKQENIELVEIFATIEHRIKKDIERENAEQAKLAVATQPIAIRTSRGSAPIPTSNGQQIDPVAEKSYFEERWARPGAERAIEELSRLNETPEQTLVSNERCWRQYLLNQNRTQMLTDDLQETANDIAADRERIRKGESEADVDWRNATNNIKRRANMVELAAELRGDSIKNKEEKLERIKNQLEDARVQHEQEKLVRLEAEHPGFLKRQELEKARLERIRLWDEQAEREMATLKSLEMYSSVRKKATAHLRDSHAPLSVDEEFDLKELVKELRTRLEEAQVATIANKPKDSFAVRNFYAALHDRAEEFGLKAIYKLRTRQEQRARKKAKTEAQSKKLASGHAQAVDHLSSSAAVTCDSYDDSRDREQARRKQSDDAQQAETRRQQGQRDKNYADAQRTVVESQERTARELVASQKAITDSNTRMAESARRLREAAEAASRAAATGQMGTHSGGYSVQQPYHTYSTYTSR